MPKDKPEKPKKGKALNAVLVDVPDEGDTYPAKVTGVEVKSAGDIFGDKAREPEKPMIEVSFEGPGGIEGRTTYSAPGITSDGKVIVRNPKSFLYLFVRKYKKGPAIGLPVEVAIDENGFYRILLE